MLEQILDFIHNYFVKEIYKGKFDISSGSIDADFLLEGQWFKIVGSVLNDGIYQYPTSDLKDETFKGEIWAMAVPPAVVALSLEVQDWVDKYGAASKSPFSSESFGGYSYTMASGTSNGSNNSPNTWQAVFGSRLNHWRKIS